MKVKRFIRSLSAKLSKELQGEIGRCTDPEQELSPEQVRALTEAAERFSIKLDSGPGGVPESARASVLISMINSPPKTTSGAKTIHSGFGEKAAAA